MSIARHLANNIEALRTKKGMSQAELARLAGVPRSTLTNIESGSGNPSLQNLVKISSALQIRIEELLSRPRNDVELIRAKEIEMEKRVQGRVRISKLLPDAIRGLDVDKIEIEVNTTMPGHPHLAGAKEYFALLQGEVVVAVGGEKYEVKRGDVLAFPGDQPHSYRNTGSGSAIGISVIIPVVLT